MYGATEILGWLVRTASMSYPDNADIKAILLESATLGSNALGYLIHVTFLRET